jgi:hypothetical protein
MDLEMVGTPGPTTDYRSGLGITWALSGFGPRVATDPGEHEEVLLSLDGE